MNPTPQDNLLFTQTSKARETPKYEFQLLVPFKDVASTFGDMLCKWFYLINKSKVALDVCFGTLYQPSTVLELRFLTAMQSIESFHRSLGTGLYMDQDKYNAAIAPLLNAIPNDLESNHKTSLKSRLKYGNEFSLLKRLNAILKSLPSNLCEAIAIDRDQFVNQRPPGPLPFNLAAVSMIRHWPSTLRPRPITGKPIAEFT